MKKPTEILVVHQGFEEGDLGRVSDFTMNDFRGEKLPLYSREDYARNHNYHRIEAYKPEDRCPKGYSWWITGKNGKLKLFRENYDSSD